ncbi:MAG: DNA primase [Candidatus Eisenbacteria bacterium]
MDERSAGGEGAIEEVRAASDIVGVVGAYVRLRKAGRNFKGLCPFHKEKTPSFIVSPDRETFHCFGCGKGGDVFTFVMETEGVGFGEALRTLAQRAGIRLPERGDGRAREKRDRLYGLLELAERFYRGAIGSKRAETARRFLDDRRIAAETSERFGLGFAPDEWRVLRDRAREEGYRDDELVETGLAIRKEGGAPYDRFRGRLLFPIRNVGGRTIGFGGRILGEGEPKYLNSPETDLFRKGEALYGLSETKGEIRSEGTAILVEGYTDLLALWQAGFRNVVAPLGTAFTPGQARLVGNYAERALVLFDGDEAGLRATLRSFETLLGAGLDPRVVDLPAGSDPDEVIRAEGPEALAKRLEGAVGLVPFILDRAHGGEKEAGIRALVGVLAAVRDEIRLSLLVQEAADRTGVPEEVILREVGRRKREEDAPGPAAVRLSPRTRKRLLDAERGIAYIAWEHPDLLPVIQRAVDPDKVEDLPARKLLQALVDCAAKGDDPGPGLLTAAGVDHEFSRIRIESDPEGDPLPTLQDYIACVREEEISRQLCRTDEALKEAESRNDSDACHRLLQERSGLAKQRHRIVAALRGDGSGAETRSPERSESS